MLGPSVTAALDAVAVEIERRTGEPVALEGLWTNRGAINYLLDLLAHPAARPLRVAARRALPERAGDDAADSDDDRDLALALTAPDAETAGSAADVVRRRVDEHRRSRRRTRRRSTTTAAERAAERDRKRLDQLRQQRDRARAQLATATDEARTLRSQVEELLDDVGALRARLDAAERRLGGARADATSIEWLASTLVAALQRETTPPQTIDPRPVAPGDSGPLQSTDRERAVQSLSGMLTRAAEHAGLPATVAEQADRWLPVLLSALPAPPAPARVLSERTLTVDVLGGGTEVGGSCVLVTAGDTRLLIDAGSRPGGTDASTLAPCHIERALAGRIHGIIVTHAHNDHAGWVPAVVARQPDVPVIVTDATAALLATMWEDSAKVLSRRMQDLDNQHINGRDIDGRHSDGRHSDGRHGGNGGPVPPFSREDVRRALGQVRIVNCNSTHQIGHLRFELFPAGHIVGAAGVVVFAGDRRVVISGDVSKAGQASVGGIAVPGSAEGADLLLLESTYAGAGRPTPRPVAVANFLRDVAQTVAGGGTVLVPAFALGRAQEVALVLAQHLPDVDVLVDGLARDVCEIYEQQPGPDGRPMSIFRGRVRPVPRGHTRAEMARMGPGVVVATSGMLHGGPSVQWARKVLPDPRGRLMVVGYQDEESPGRRLVDLARAGGGTLELPNAEGGYEPVAVAAAVGTYGLGAHADADDLVTISAQIAARQVMLVHGDLTGQRAFAERLRLRGQDTLLADRGWKAPPL